MTPRTALVLVAAALALAGCAVEPGRLAPPAMTADEGRALVAKLLPPSTADRTGWATDLYAAIVGVGAAPTAQSVCAAIAVIEQESTFRADPSVPNLPAIARRELDRRREQAGLPAFALNAALALPSSDGRSYGERLDKVRTERELSELFEDFIGRVPFGRTLLASRNPVRTGGPMQVSIAFAESYAKERPYPYPVSGSIRHEVFTRRGGLWFGVAHLLDYDAPYDRAIYRFADFNAGRYASRNAAFQRAVTDLTGVTLALDGDLVIYDGGMPARDAGSTELATRTLGGRLSMSAQDIRRDLEQGRDASFERTRLYERVFRLADAAAGRPAPRAALPTIEITGPKITRRFTTDAFARRVDTRYQSCLARAG